MAQITFPNAKLSFPEAAPVRHRSVRMYSLRSDIKIAPGRVQGLWIDVERRGESVATLSEIHTDGTPAAMANVSMHPE